MVRSSESCGRGPDVRRMDRTPARTAAIIVNCERYTGKCCFCDPAATGARGRNGPRAPVRVRDTNDHPDLSTCCQSVEAGRIDTDRVVQIEELPAVPALKVDRQFRTRA